MHAAYYLTVCSCACNRYTFSVRTLSFSAVLEEMEVLDTTRRLTSLNSVNVCIPITNGAFHVLCEVDRDEIAQNPSSTSNLIMILKDEVADMRLSFIDISWAQYLLIYVRGISEHVHNPDQQSISVRQ